MSVLTFFLIYTFHCVNFDAIALIENDTFWNYSLILFTNNIQAWFYVVWEKTETVFTKNAIFDKCGGIKIDAMI